MVSLYFFLCEINNVQKSVQDLGTLLHVSTYMYAKSLRSPQMKHTRIFTISHVSPFSESNPAKKTCAIENLFDILMIIL